MMIRRSYGSYLVFYKDIVVKIFEPQGIVKYINLLFTGKAKNPYNSLIGAYYAYFKKNLIRNFLQELSKEFNVEIIVPKAIGIVKILGNYGIVMERVRPKGIKLTLEKELRRTLKEIIKQVEIAGIPIWQYSLLRSLFGKEVDIYEYNGRILFYLYDWESGVVHPSKVNPIIGFDFIDFKRFIAYIKRKNFKIDRNLLRKTIYLQNLFKKTLKIIFNFK